MKQDGKVGTSGRLWRSVVRDPDAHMPRINRGNGVFCDSLIAC